LFGGEDDPDEGRKYVVTATADGEEAMTVRLRAQDPSVALEKREEQALLSLIKGNIQ